MECAAEAAAAALMGQSVFDYNRKNFMFDRELRLHKEFKELKFRVIQADLWRQDIRDIISLVEIKCKKYLLVNVLMLGFTISLWVQGMLPETTPDWLMLGNQVAIGGAFTFLLLTVWLAMHASISAQGFQTRLLTQLVRLPIPTWEELEAARTYGSSYEKIEARQMFRIPFLMGKQESLVPDQDVAAPPTASIADPVAAAAPAANVPTDPWGLESRGDNNYGLGCPYNQDCAELRHIVLVRQAAQFWQSYDAYARISMSIGVNQLILAMSYYILGYVLVQARAPWSAFAGVVALVGLAQVVAYLDMTLPKYQQLIMTGLVVAGPSFACIACYHWSMQFGDMAAKLSKAFAPAAFASHGLLVFFFSYTCGVRDTKGGGLLPTAFKQVLYLDVFGWTSRWSKQEDPVDSVPLAEQEEEQVPSSLEVPHATLLEPLPPSRLRSFSQEDREGPCERAAVNYYALDYMEPVPQQQGDPCHEFGDGEALAAPLPTPAGPPRVGGPALQTISYDPRNGQALPISIGDLAPSGVQQDLRCLAGAPRESEPVSQTDKPQAFFDATSFYPRVGDEKQRKREQAREVLDPIVSGHDRELPGRVPMSVFMFGTYLLGSIWMVAAIYQLLDANGLMGYFTKFRIDTVEINTQKLYNMTLNEMKASKEPLASLLQTWSGSQGSRSAVEELDVSVPFSHILPQGFSCDAAGRHFAITDGLSTFVGEAAPRKTLRKQGLGRTSRPVAVEFVEVARCAALLGEALQDTAIACGGTGAVNSAECELLLLHHRGKRVASCPIAKDLASVGHGKVAALSQRWLQNKQSQKSEKAAWLLLDADCVRDSTKSSRMGCASVGTTLGRVAHLQHSDSEEPSAPVGALFPDTVMPEVASGRDNEARSSGMVRALNGRYLGVLQSDRSGIQVLDRSNDLASMGALKLPVEATVDGFCAGGGYVYVLSQGVSLRMWRVPLPSDLVA